MWTSNVCSTLHRSQGAHAHLGTLLRNFSVQAVGRHLSIKQLVASSFYKTRAIIKFVFGRSTPEFAPKLHNYSVAIRNVSETSSSVLGRFVAGKQYPVRRFNAYFENGRFRAINRKHLTGTGLTLGLVGVCIKDENGFPILSQESQSKTFSWNEFYQNIKTQTFELKQIREDINEVNDIEFKECISKGCSGVVYKANINSNEGSAQEVAVKMLFNYDIESNSSMIFNGCAKECVPYNGKFGHYNMQRKKLPPHPNIVKILSVFVDYFQPLDNCKQLYPHALPLQYGGYGRNMTLFIVEKLYDMTLKQYLNLHSPSFDCSLAIFTQCLDAIDFLNVNSIAHRDLKADNILVSLSDEECPWVVISDFGLCTTSLVVPFPTDEVCRGGNRALMAPEIVNAMPSPRAVLDYTKSDLWSMGTIAYEIFGANNPFYKATPQSSKLNSASYEECHLPQLPIKSRLLQALIQQILSRSPDKRPTTAFAAGLSQLLFHMGAKSVAKLVKLSNDQQLRSKLIDDWFKSFTYRTMFDMMNNREPNSFQNKMRIVFLAKMQSGQARSLIDDISLYLQI